jgi:hypothetical protein
LKSDFPESEFRETNMALKLLHIDLFGPIRTRNISGNRYVFIIIDDFTKVFVIIDNFTRYTWVLFLNFKDETIYVFLKFL